SPSGSCVVTSNSRLLSRTVHVMLSMGGDSLVVTTSERYSVPDAVRTLSLHSWPSSTLTPLALYSPGAISGSVKTGPFSTSMVTWAPVSGDGNPCSLRFWEYVNLIRVSGSAISTIPSTTRKLVADVISGGL